jgi:hypothetical protein
MAEPYDSATTLMDLSNVLQEQYFGEFLEQTVRNHEDLNRMFEFMPEPVTGDGKTFQMETGPGDTVRAGTDPLADVAAPNRFNDAKIKVRWNQNDTTAHDFCRLSGSAQVDYYTMDNGSNGAIVDVADRIFRQVTEDFSEKLAIHRVLGRNPVLARVNGTPVQNDEVFFADGTASPTNSTGVKFAVDSGSIGYFREGQILDVYDDTNSTYSAQKLEVVDVNYSDNSIGLKYNSSGLPARQSSGDIADIADNDQIFFSGTRNAGMYSIGAYMADPTDDTNFIGGLNRVTAANRWANPHSYLAGTSTSNAIVDKSHLNGAARVMQYRRNNNNGVVAVCQIDLHDTLRDSYGEDAFVPMPTDEAQKARFAHLGFVGLNFQHPTFGMIQLTSNSLYPVNVVDILTPNRWKTCVYQTKDWKWVPGQVGPWYRVGSATPGNGDSLIYKADGLANMVDFCTAPKDNCRIKYVAAE